jgi:hypothetical protein
MPRYDYTPPPVESAEDAETVRIDDVRHVLEGLDGDRVSRKITENVSDPETVSPRVVGAKATTPTNPGAPARSRVAGPDPSGWTTPAPSVRRAHGPDSWWGRAVSYVRGWIWPRRRAVLRRPS